MSERCIYYGYAGVCGRATEDYTPDRVDLIIISQETGARTCYCRFRRDDFEGQKTCDDYSVSRDTATDPLRLL